MNSSQYIFVTLVCKQNEFFFSYYKSSFVLRINYEREHEQK
jgi:hypothetical protein